MDIAEACFALRRFGFTDETLMGRMYTELFGGYTRGGANKDDAAAQAASGQAPRKTMSREGGSKRHTAAGAKTVQAGAKTEGRFNEFGFHAIAYISRAFCGTADGLGFHSSIVAGLAKRDPSEIPDYQVNHLSSLLRAWGDQQVEAPWAFFTAHPQVCKLQTPITLLRIFQAFADTHWHFKHPAGTEFLARLLERAEQVLPEFSRDPEEDVEEENLLESPPKASLAQVLQRLRIAQVVDQAFHGEAGRNLPGPRTFVKNGKPGKEIEALTAWLMTAGPLAGVVSCRSIITEQIPELADEDLDGIFRKLPAYTVPAAIGLISWCGLKMPEKKVDKNTLVLSTEEEKGPDEWTDVVGPSLVRRIEDFDSKQRADMLIAMLYSISPDEDFPEKLPWWAMTFKHAVLPAPVGDPWAAELRDDFMKVMKAEGPGYAEDLLLELPCAHDKTALCVVEDRQTVLVRSPEGIDREMSQDVVFPVALLRRRGWTVAVVHRKTMEIKQPERYRPDLIRRILEAAANAEHKPYNASLIHLEIDTDSD
jgi:hypothetical protein